MHQQNKPLDKGRVACIAEKYQQGNTTKNRYGQGYAPPQYQSQPAPQYDQQQYAPQQPAPQQYGQQRQ